jgi:gliding motility-associated-like protein
MRGLIFNILLFLIANNSWGQMGSIIGDHSVYRRLYSVFEKTNDVDITLSNPNFKSQCLIENQTHIAVTNQGNVLFYASDTSIYNYKKVPIASSSKAFFQCGSKANVLSTSALFEFAGRKFLLFGITGSGIIGSDNSDELRYSKIDAANTQDIRIISSNNILQRDTWQFSQLTSARLNDSIYLMAAANYNGDVFFYHVKWNSVTLISKYNLLNNIKLFDLSTYNKPERSSQKQLVSFKLSNKANKLYCVITEDVNDRIPIVPPLYTYSTILRGHRVVIYDLDPTKHTVRDSTTLIKFTPPAIVQNVHFPYVAFSPNDSFIYVSQINYPNRGIWNVTQYPITDQNTVGNSVVLCQVPYDFPRYSALFLSHNGGILQFQSDNSSSNYLYWDKSDSKYSGNGLIKSTPKNWDYYSLDQPTPFVYNYIKIRPEPFNGCESKYIFKNRSNQGRRFNRFIYYFAKDTAGQLWDTATSFEPIYTYKTAGKFAYKCLGLTADGYSEWFEDSVTISNIPTPEITAIVAPSLQLVTMLNNRRVQVQWKPLKGANKYSIFKDGILFRQTTDTIFIDELSTNISRPIQYQIQAEDLCGNSSSLSNVGRTIFLKVEVIPSTNWSTAQSTRLTWNPYEFWNEGVLNYEVESKRESSPVDWTLIERVNDTITIDKSFVEQGLFSKCYRITAVRNLSNIKSQSNIICVAPDPILFVPSAFTPDGNGLNDGFQVTAMGFAKFSLTIYNSWGQKIHTQINSTDSWKPDQNVPAGVYVYQIRATNANGAEYSYSGTITLIR